jgi:hypothetical protein
MFMHTLQSDAGSGFASLVCNRTPLAATVPFPKRPGHPEEYASLALEMIRNGYFNAETVRPDGAIRMQPR